MTRRCLLITRVNAVCWAGKLDSKDASSTVGQPRADAALRVIRTRTLASEARSLDHFTSMRGNMRAARYAIAGIFALVSVTAGCIDMGQIRDLQALATAINARYKAPAGINLMTGGQLTITFQNSKYAELPPAARKEFALDVARFAVARSAARDSVRVVRVGFKSTKGMGAVTLSRSEVPYSWSLAELQTMPDSGAMAPIKEQPGAGQLTKR